MTDKRICQYCGAPTRIGWVIFNHGPVYNPFRVCEIVCTSCRRPQFTEWFHPIKTNRKSKIARCRLEFNQPLVSALAKGLEI